MAVELTLTKIVAQLAGTIKNTLGDGGKSVLAYDKGLFQEIPSDANLLFSQGYNIATSSNQSLDLSGSLVDALGVACVFSKVYAILVINLATATGRNIAVGGDSNHVPIFGAGADFITIGPKGCFQAASCVDGWDVTAGTGDIIKIANSAGGATIPVAVAILGKS